jgi:phosphohistidine phosphatase
VSTRRLILLRHAKAEHGLDVPDHDRPLAPTGRRQSVQVGAGLAAAGLVPDVVLCSSSVRTRQTWQIAATTLATEAAGAVEPQVVYSDALYDAGPADVLAAVRGVDASAGVVLVVGHEPAISRAAALLAGPGSDEAVRTRVYVGVPTGSWSVLAPWGEWADLAHEGARLLALHVP